MHSTVHLLQSEQSKITLILAIQSPSHLIGSKSSTGAYNSRSNDPLRAYQRTVGLTSVSPQAEVNNNLDRLGVIYGQHVDFTSGFHILNRNYRYRFVSIQIPHDDTDPLHWRKIPPPTGNRTSFLSRSMNLNQQDLNSLTGTLLVRNLMKIFSPTYSAQLRLNLICFVHIKFFRT